MILLFRHHTVTFSPAVPTPYIHIRLQYKSLELESKYTRCWHMNIFPFSYTLLLLLPLLRVVSSRLIAGFSSIPAMLLAGSLLSCWLPTSISSARTRRLRASTPVIEYTLSFPCIIHNVQCYSYSRVRTLFHGLSLSVSVSASLAFFCVFPPPINNCQSVVFPCRSGWSKTEALNNKKGWMWGGKWRWRAETVKHAESKTFLKGERMNKSEYSSSWYR